MLMGLLQGQEKMSKSDPNSAIFMEDSEADVSVKVKKSYCPPGIVEANPCLEYINYVILPWQESFEIVRKEENGGNKCVLSRPPRSYASCCVRPACVARRQRCVVQAMSLGCVDAAGVRGSH
jgi:hypothetical protein